MAPSKRVRAGERDNLLVVEAHAVEDLADVVGALVAVGEAAVGGAVLDVAASNNIVSQCWAVQLGSATHPSLRPARQGM